MAQFEQLNKLLKVNKGVIRAAQALELGITKPAFYTYIEQKGMERIAHGIYAQTDAWVDYMHLVHLRCKQGVFSHDTALFLNNLADREPMAYSITVKAGYNPYRLKADGIQVYSIKKELYSVGIVTAKTPFGNDVPVYGLERTICDIIRSRRNIEAQTFQNALKQYVQRRDKNLRVLIKYAELFHVEKILRQYLEVLL